MIIAYEACPHAECEQYYASSRGLLTRTVVCHHPENQGCVCVKFVDPDAECVWCEEEANTETEAGQTFGD
jgi:hypothetical protein